MQEQDILSKIEEILDSCRATNVEYNSRINRHQERVTAICRCIAEIMELPKDRIEILDIAARFHDYGKKIWHKEMIFRKKEKMCEYELGLIRTHAEASCCLIRNDLEAFDQNLFNLLNEKYKDVFDIIRYHHKDYDGNGYPEGISGKDMPLEAHILRVADAYDAMRSPRLYRSNDNQMMGHKKTLYKIIAKKGKEFHPDVVRALRLVPKENLEIHYIHVTYIDSSECEKNVIRFKYKEN